jgi:CRP-like cAMP-binding protein
MSRIELAAARGNTLLNGLADDDLAELLLAATEADLTLGAVLYEPGQPVPAVHFPLSGVISIVADLGDGEVVEAATVGSEGMSGITVFLGAGPPTERASVQVKGHALTMTAEAFGRAAAAADGPLHAMMRRYAHTLFTQLARNAACNRVHTVEQRAARWLLATADRMHSPTFELTQHFLAEMLSVRRASISKTARTLATNGCITYVRGTITILDRARLQSYACACYQTIHDHTARTLAVTGPAPG